MFEKQPRNRKISLVPVCPSVLITAAMSSLRGGQGQALSSEGEILMASTLKAKKINSWVDTKAPGFRSQLLPVTICNLKQNFEGGTPKCFIWRHPLSGAFRDHSK